jgi:protein-disulfide isomerase
MKNKHYFYIGTTALIIAFFIIGASLYKESQQKKLSFLAEEKAELFIRDYSPRYGNKDAKVYLIEFLDPECESCRAFYPHIKKLLQDFEGKVQLVVRYAPFHGNSKEVIRALEASKLQGKYWESLEHLFATQPKWGSHHHPQVELIYEFLPQIGVDVKKLKEDMKNPEYQKIIDQDLADLRALGVRGTPTFFVNGKSPEAFSFQALRKLLSEEVQKAYP